MILLKILGIVVLIALILWIQAALHSCMPGATSREVSSRSPTLTPPDAKSSAITPSATTHLYSPLPEE